MIAALIIACAFKTMFAVWTLIAALENPHGNAFDMTRQGAGKYWFGMTGMLISFFVIVVILVMSVER
jgi:hypothetical protein